MAVKFEDLVNGMINVSVGAASLAAERGKAVLDDLSAKGEEVRSADGSAAAPDFARSMSDVFQAAGGAFSDVTDRLGAQGASVAERVLDELILARARQLTPAERDRFVTHVGDLVRAVADEPVTVEVETVEPDDGADDGDAAQGPVA